MGNSETYLKFLLAVLAIAVNCLSGLVLAAFKSYLNTREAEKRIQALREDSQNKRLADIERKLDIVPGNNQSG